MTATDIALVLAFLAVLALARGVELALQVRRCAGCRSCRDARERA